MAITAYPRPNESITSAQFQAWSRRLISTGAVDGAAFLPYGDSSGLNVKFAPGFAIVDGIPVASTSVETRTIAAGSGGSLSRIDTLVANLDYSTNPIVSFAVIAGIPSASSPAAPSLALSGSVVFRWPIANILVSPTASTITAANVVDRRSFTSQSVGLWTTDLRPVSPRVGTFGFNATLNALEVHDGSAWGPVTSTALDASVITSGTLNDARLPTISVAKGGTGATSASAALTNLGAQPAGSYAATSHVHSGANITSGVISLPINNSSYVVTPGIRATDYAYDIRSDGSATISSTLTIGSLTCNGGATVSGLLYNSPARSNAVSGQALYIASNGQVGVGASTERFKKKIVATDLDGALALKVAVRDFVYDPKQVESDGSVQTGVIAEELVKLGLQRFVIFDAQGVVTGVHYDKLALLALAGLQSEAKRLDVLEARLTALEK
jgi:hypothetical protein